MATSVWSSVSVAVQSALASAVTITGITKADPGVAATTSPPTAGDFVLLTVSGMHQVNGRVFRVGTVVAGTSFQLEGEDTTNYDTFVSGSFQVITFGTSIQTITGVSASGGEPEFADDTTIHVAQRSQVPTVLTPLVYSMESLWDPSDAGLDALKSATIVKATRCVKFAFADGRKLVFNGHVAAALVPTGTAQDKVITPVTFNATALPTAYAT